MKNRKHKKISKIVSIISGLFLALQIIVGVFMPMAFDFWRPSLQKAGAASPGWAGEVSKTATNGG